MSQNNENKLVPRLRFPEFKNTQAWLLRTLNDVADMYQPKTISQSEFKDKGHLVYGANGVIGYYDRYNHETSQIAIACRGSSCGTVNFTEPKSWITGNAMVVNVDGFKDIDKKFMFYQLLVANFNYLITGSGQPQITGNIKNHKVVLTNLEEQQKIAACLSSLDDVITAESKKLEVLKEHKKGLLQNLFPQEGETVPKLRFKEFENSGEWKEKYLNEISPAIFDGTHQTPSYTEKGVPFYSVENIKSGIKNKFISREDYLLSISKNKPEKGDIIITRIGDIGTSKVIDWNYEFSIYVTLAIVKKSTIFNSYYLHSFFQSSRYQKEILSKSLLNAVPCKINMDELRRTKILIPPDKGKKEQLKISEIFSSVDDLINSQSQKIETLKLHKKGLLQGLFPDVNEHNG